MVSDECKKMRNEIFIFLNYMWSENLCHDYWIVFVKTGYR
nr:MAG TPA: hypothetical protein [Bacteriophage sp.]